MQLSGSSLFDLEREGDPSDQLRGNKVEGKLQLRSNQIERVGGFFQLLFFVEF